jgi:hypothetical protein
MEKTETINSNVGKETRTSLSLHSYSVVLEFLAKAVRQEEEIKGIQIGKEEVKLSLFADDMISYLRDLKNSTKKSPTHHKHL